MEGKIDEALIKDILVWIISINDSPFKLDAALQLLPEEELIRAGSIVFENDRRQYIIERAVLRLILSKYLDIGAPEDIAFSYTALGKPYIPGSSYSFNFSNTTELAVLAVSRSGEVGIDIEYMNRRLPTTAIINKCFSSIERLTYVNLPVDQRLKYFFHIWTAKEAYTKATGKGITIPLNTISIYSSPPDRKTSIHTPQESNENQNWIIHDLGLGNPYIGSLATSSELSGVRQIAISLEDIAAIFKK